MTLITYQSKITYVTRNEIFNLRGKCLNFSQSEVSEACPMQSICSDGKAEKKMVRNKTVDLNLKLINKF
jgi:hypothetical protein